MELVIGMTVRYINKKNREKIGVIETDLNEKKYVVLTNGKKVKRDKIISEWKPKNNEVCLFSNDFYKSSRIAKFNYFSYDSKKYGYKDMQGNYFKFCLPFTKENLKKIKYNLIKG